VTLYCEQADGVHSAAIKKHTMVGLKYFKRGQTQGWGGQNMLNIINNSGIGTHLFVGSEAERIKGALR